MNDETYETIKTTLAEEEQLFAKLHRVAREYDAIDFDESGFYDEEVERCERHWNTLATKIADALRTRLGDAEVRLLKNPEPNLCTLRFDITTTEETGTERSRLSVDYATEGQIAISREALA